MAICRSIKRSEQGSSMAWTAIFLATVLTFYGGQV